MNRAARLVALLAVTSLLGAIACVAVREPTGPAADATPVPGRLVVALDGEDAGAVMLVLEGAGIGEPQALKASDELFARPVDSAASRYRIALVGDRLSGGLFSFAVPDINKAASYAATLVEVADQANSLFASLESHKLSVRPEE